MSGTTGGGDPAEYYSGTSAQFRPTIIGGGGVRNIEVATNYLERGADHISVSTLCFNPISFLNFYWEYTNQF